jgi:hypothetical protein
METFDMKPEAPLEYRGEFRPISTRVPGLEISEHLPLLADQAERLAIIRSLHHDSPGHVNSTHTMLTGYPGSLMEAPPYQPDYPDFWSVVSKVQHPGPWNSPPHHHASPPLPRQCVSRRRTRSVRRGRAIPTWITFRFPTWDFKI